MTDVQIKKSISKKEAEWSCSEVVDDELATNVLVSKYFLCDQDRQYYEWNPMQMWDRLADAIVKAEPKERQDELLPEFRQLVDNFKFVPAGRVLYGLGNPFVDNITLKNCYVLDIEEDSIKGIFQAIWHMAEVYKAGGGCGIDISKLRPSGSPVRNAARYASGPVSFMELFSRVTGTIGQQARIGAMLISLDISHPDVEGFIDIKSGDDLDKVRYANVSVKITDEFMQAVEDDRDFDLRWGGKVWKTVRARELWGKIIHSAWARGEPGILFWDTTCRRTPAHVYPDFRCISTNPCLSGDMRIFTEKGYRTAYELWGIGGFREHTEVINDNEGGELRVVNNAGVVPATCVYRTAESAPLYRVTFDNGSYVDATPNHKFIVLAEGLSAAYARRALEKLKIGDQVPICRQTSFGNTQYLEYAQLAGWVIGDGSISRTPAGMRAHVRCWDDDIESALPTLRESMLAVYKQSNQLTDQKPEYKAHESVDDGFGYTKKTIQSLVLGRLLAEDGLSPGNKHRVPNSIWDGTETMISEFLSGLFSADGGVQINERKKCASIRLSQSNERILLECQLLLTQLGIDSDLVHRRKESKQWMNDGKGGKKLYNRRAQYELIISRRENLVNFAEKIGFIQKWKNDILQVWLGAHRGSNNSARRTDLKVRSIEYLGEEQTFCLTEPADHEVTVAGIRIGQCGEVALSHGDSCNLGSINLGKYVANSFDNPYIDYDALVYDTRTAVRFLDNIITLEHAPLDFQQKANDNGRRLGLGVMGLADMFLRMNVRYGSPDSMKLADEVFTKFMCASYEASCDLAEEKGTFPAYDRDTHFNSKFVQHLPEAIQKRIGAVGLRNISINAIAPTGSISCVAGCSSGIEPVFMMKHIRKTNLGTAKEVQEHEVFHPVAVDYLKRYHGGEMNEALLPNHFVSAHDVEPCDRIKLQGIIQRRIDLSISNTVNLAEDCKEADVSNSYRNAWRAGCKGITVYRDGSREGVLVSAEKKVATEIKPTQAAKRPEVLDAKVHLIKPNGKVFTVFVGLLKGRPYEVFALDNGLAGISDGTEGKIVRSKDGNANIYHFEQGALQVRMLNRYEDQEASLVTRLLSTSLRHGVPLAFLIDQMSKSKVNISSFAKAITRALSLYIRQDEVKGQFKCPECNSHNLKFEGVCKTCRDCGWSRCS